MATHSPSSKTPKLVAIRRRVATHQSVLLSDVQAADLLPALRVLVLDADPSSAADAAATLSSACRFLADEAPESGCDLDVLLTEANVARWSHVQKRAGMNEGTLKNHLGRLGRHRHQGRQGRRWGHPRHLGRRRRQGRQGRRRGRRRCRRGRRRSHRRSRKGMAIPSTHRIPQRDIVKFWKRNVRLDGEIDK